MAGNLVDNVSTRDRSCAVADREDCVGALSATNMNQCFESSAGFTSETCPAFSAQNGDLEFQDVPALLEICEICAKLA